jgi:hypothetical protein
MPLRSSLVVLVSSYGDADEPYDLPMPYGPGEPGDMYATDADLTIYWPWVRPCWEEDVP